MSFYWIHANIDGQSRWHLVYDKDPGLLFVAADFEEDNYDIVEYRKEFPHNKVVGPIQPPLPCTCDENCDDPCPAHGKEHAFQNRIIELESDIVALRHDLEVAEYEIKKLRKEETE